MPLIVNVDTETGTATLTPSVPLPVDKALRFSLQDTSTRRYLTASGLSPNRKTLFEARLSEGNQQLTLPPEMAAQLTGGTPLLLEEIYVNYRESFIWPKPKAPLEPPAAQEPEASVPNTATEPTTVEAIEKHEELVPNVAPALDVPSPSTSPTSRSHSRVWYGSVAALVLAVCLAVWMVNTSEAPPQPQSFNTTQAEKPAVSDVVVNWLYRLTDNVAAILTTYDEQLAARDQTLKRQESLVNALHTSLETMRTDLAQARRNEDEARGELSRIIRENMRLSQEQASADANSDTIVRLKAEITRQENLVISLRRQLAQAAAPPLLPSPPSSTGTETEKLLRDRNTALTTEVAEQKAEITRQENLVISLRRQLAQAAAPALLPTPSSTARETEQLLRDRNVALTTEVETQNHTITALERDLATYKGMVKQLQEQPLATTNEVGRFGALAASRDGIVFLTEQGFATEDAARTAAIVGCRQFSNNNSCRIEDTFSDMCAAVARVSPTNRQSRWQVSYGRNQIEAEETALRECFDLYKKRCMITVSGVCAGVTR